MHEETIGKYRFRVDYTFVDDLDLVFDTACAQMVSDICGGVPTGQDPFLERVPIESVLFDDEETAVRYLHEYACVGRTRPDPNDGTAYLHYDRQEASKLGRWGWRLGHWATASLEYVEYLFV